jgi:phenylalanyl-tRNA synthetase beta chain
MAGGELFDGVVVDPPYSGTDRANRHEPVKLRNSQVARVLGIEVPWSRSLDILKRLGCQTHETLANRECDVIPPSFRQDLSREIDLIEEIARIYGYDRIPEDAMVPMVASARRPKDAVMGTVRSVACAAGFDETLNPSLIGKGLADRISPWCRDEALSTMVPLLEGASVLRRSLIPSLIAARLHNQSQSNRDVRLFETANAYLSRGSGLPEEVLVLGCIAEGDQRIVRGVFEEVLERSWGGMPEGWTQSRADWDFLEAGSGVQWRLGDRMVGWVGTISKSLAQSIKLDGAASVGELNLNVLLERARAVPQLRDVVPYPAIERDLNFIVEESVTWDALRATIASAAGALCVDIAFREIYRDTKRDGAGKKRMLLTLTLQSQTETLRSEQADAVVQSVVDACRQQWHAQLLAS